MYPLRMEGSCSFRVLPSVHLSQVGCNLLWGMEVQLLTSTVVNLALHCSCSMQYQSKNNTKFDKENQLVKKQQYRKTTLHNKRSNNRPSSQIGRSTSRQTSSKRTLYKGDVKCKFRLPVYTNGKVFFIKGQMGTAWHNNHVPRNPDLAVLCMPTRLMSEKEKGTLKDAILL
jgi:hypothetical protein